MTRFFSCHLDADGAYNLGHGKRAECCSRRRASAPTVHMRIFRRVCPRTSLFFVARLFQYSCVQRMPASVCGRVAHRDKCDTRVRTASLSKLQLRCLLRVALLAMWNTSFTTRGLRRVKTAEAHSSILGECVSVTTRERLTRWHALARFFFFFSCFRALSSSPSLHFSLFLYTTRSEHMQTSHQELL